MSKKAKLYAAISLFVQALSFIVTAIALYSKKKSLAGTFLAIGLLGGTAGSVLWALYERDNANERRLAAVDGGYMADDEDDEDWFDYSPCDYPECNVKDEYEIPFVETEEAGEDEFDLGE